MWAHLSRRKAIIHVREIRKTNSNQGSAMRKEKKNNANDCVAQHRQKSMNKQTPTETTANEIYWKHHEYAYIPALIAMVTIEVTALETNAN